jgi:hypothetical protein
MDFLLLNSHFFCSAHIQRSEFMIIHQVCSLAFVVCYWEETVAG